MDQFDWLGFVDEESIQTYIDFRNQRFNLYGGAINTITGLNIAKLQLLRIEQELKLYRLGVKEGLSSDEIELAKQTIDRHWNNIMNIESQIQLQAGFRVAIEKASYSVFISNLGRFVERPIFAIYRDSVRNLYEGDYKVLLSIVEKENKNLYSSLAYNDESFAALVLPQVEQYTAKIGNIASFYHNALLFLDQNKTSTFDADNISVLLGMHDDSLEVYKCFLENFPNPVGESQENLRQIIESWHEQQSVWGAEALMRAYQYGVKKNPWAVAKSLHDFKTLPLEMKIKIAEFYRDEFLHNPDFIGTHDPYSQGARTNALIGLALLNFLKGQEVELFNRAIEEGVIKKVGEGSFLASTKPLPTLL